MLARQALRYCLWRGVGGGGRHAGGSRADGVLRCLEQCRLVTRAVCHARTASSADATDSLAGAPPPRGARGPRAGRPAPEEEGPVAPDRICRRSSAAGSRVSFSRSRDSTDAFLECAGLLRSLSPVKEEFAGEPASEPPSSGSLPYCAMADAAGSTRAAPEGASKPRRATRVPPARSKPRLFVPPALASRRRARGQFTHVTRSRGEDEIETSASFRRRAGA